MNWPPLSPECTKAISEVLEDVVSKKPADPVEHMARLLAERSGLDPAAFEGHFEECKRKPRTYALEEMCPASQDPMAWVPMRYNDDTIRLTLAQRVFNLASDILSSDPVEDMRDLFHQACAGYPEIQYLRGAPEEIAASQTIRAIFLACSGSADVLQPASMDDADPAMAFHCADLLESVRANMFEPVLQADALPSAPQTEAVLDTLFVCCIFRVLGTSPMFQARLGGGLGVPDQAAAHAVEHNSEALPSFQRLPQQQRDLVRAVLQAHFPLDSVVCSEAVPAHFLRSKETVGTFEGALRFAVAVGAVERLVQCRLARENRGVEFLRLSGQCLTALEKYNPPRAYDMYLKKRAERHSWRLVKDDFKARCIIRLCVLAKLEETADWSAMESVFHSLDQEEKELLTTEIGRKDGVVEMQAYVLLGASVFMEQAWANQSIGATPALRLLARIFQEAARACVRLENQRMVPLHLEALGPFARQWRACGTPFEDTPFMLEEGLPGEMVLTLPGQAR